jgi:hypothetical protein
MVSRDREIAKTVVYGMRTIIGLLRDIRDDLAAREAYEDEIRSLRAQITDLSEAVSKSRGNSGPSRERDYSVCLIRGCSLPQGHWGNHRGSIRTTRTVEGGAR